MSAVTLPSSINFNSIKVRLELKVNEIGKVLKYKFQFHKGTIRTFYGAFGDNRIINFNSIKVRLELTYFSTCFISSKFQFHKGTIRTSRINVHGTEKAEFQFHKGTIRTDLIEGVQTANQYFNSIKVRLERTLFANVPATLKDFNSIKVRLEQEERPHYILHCDISIP